MARGWACMKNSIKEPFDSSCDKDHLLVIAILVGLDGSLVRAHRGCYPRRGPRLSPRSGSRSWAGWIFLSDETVRQQGDFVPQVIVGSSRSSEPRAKGIEMRGYEMFKGSAR